MHQETDTFALDGPNHRRLQRREWLAERAGWLLIGLVLAAAGVGLLGPGPLSARTVTSADGRLAVEYDAIARHEAPCKLRLFVRDGGKSTPQGEVVVAFSRNLADQISTADFTPQPAACIARDEFVVYRFPSAGAGFVAIQCRFRCRAYGRQSYRVELNAGSSVSLRQFICP